MDVVQNPDKHRAEERGQQVKGHPPFESFMLDYLDDATAIIERSAGHKSAPYYPELEIRNSDGIGCIRISCFTLEACATFAAALQRFYEFVGVAARRVVLAHALAFQDAYGPDQKITELRNKGRAYVNLGSSTRAGSSDKLADLLSSATGFRRLDLPEPTS
jgi:hypothetical protein